jgi:hypothetical protein
VAVVLTRLPRSEKLTPVETMKLAAGEVAGEKSIKTLAEVIDTLNQEHDITKRFGQKGPRPAQPRPRHAADAGKLGDQRGPVHVRLRHLHGRWSG